MTETSIKIVESNFENILPIWKNQLWPLRISEIQSTSAIDDNGIIDINLTFYKPYFYEAIQNNQTIGVIGGQMTSDSMYRMRGLWVHENFRKMGVGQMLVLKNMQTAHELNSKVIWTMSRESALQFYERQGFIRYMNVDKFEYGPHVIVKKLVK